MLLYVLTCHLMAFRDNYNLLCCGFLFNINCFSVYKMLSLFPSVPDYARSRSVTDGFMISVYQFVFANIDTDTSKRYRHGLRAIKVC